PMQQQQPIQGHQQQPMQQAPPPHLQQPMQQQAPQVQQQQRGGQRIVNVSEINPIMGQPQQQQQQQQGVQPAPLPFQPPSQGQQPGVVQQPPVPGLAALPPQNGRAISGGTNRQVSDRQQVLRHQQQRLLLLRHAAKCHHEDGKCLVTPHCAGMKRLWKHIAECKDQKCLVPHCVSSRYVLSHYHRCKDVRCPVCGPVREAIHRSHEKQKQMQALKQRHQQAVQQNQQGQPPLPQQAMQPAPGSMPAQQPLQYPPHAGEPPNKRQRTSIAYQQQPVAPGQPIASAQYQQQPVPGAPPVPIQSQPSRPGYYPQQGMPQQRGIPSAGRPLIAAAPGVKFANGQVITPKFTGPKPQEDHTLINCFSIEQIETHIASLNKGLQLPPQKLKTKCLEALKILQAHQHGWVFNSPVDPVELGLPDYFEVIKTPMDLGTIRKKLENNCYHSLEDFHGNVNLTFENAMLYNPEGSVVYNMAKEMKDKFEADYDILIKQLNQEEDVKRRNGEACLLCGCEKLLFEPPIFYCNGTNCPAKRIRRNSYYYVGGNNQYHWCHQCFGDLKPSQLLELGDISVRKEQLVKKKNDETHEESWVQCDRCERWVHQICALFNTRQNKDQRSEYCCPRCTIEERKKTGRPEATSSTPMAEDLQRTKLSEFVENHVRDKMDEHFKQAAKEKAEKDGIPLEKAEEAVQMGGAITIRQVTSMDRKLEVRDRMKKRYAFKNYPDEFSYRCKCFVVFQNLDGVDVLLFGLYVYEHDENNPAPNKRTVYVSYLDSVHYMRPRSMRTFIYHEILISYLDYVRRRGFSTAHIWACPPLKGDDYILYAKPEDQKTPKDDRLRAWYIDMLVECQKRGVVGKVTNMYDLYFSNPNNNATVVPYMEGDYFPAEVENIIKDIEEGKKPGKKTTGKEGKKKKGDKKQKKKSGRGGTRSSGLDEDALKASGVQFPVDDQKPLEEGGRDIVMAKLGETIQPMKESFIVAFLAWKDAKEEDMVVPKEIQEYRETHNITCAFEPLDAAQQKESEEKKSTDDGSKPPEEKSAENAEAESTAEASRKDDAAAENGPDAVKVKQEPSTEGSKEEPKEDTKTEGDSSKDDKSEKANEAVEGSSSAKEDDVEMKDVEKADKPEESADSKEESPKKPDDSEKKEVESSVGPEKSDEAKDEPKADEGVEETSEKDEESKDEAEEAEKPTDGSDQNGPKKDGEAASDDSKDDEKSNTDAKKNEEAKDDAKEGEVKKDDEAKDIEAKDNEANDNEAKDDEAKDHSKDCDVKMDEAPKDAPDSKAGSMDVDKKDTSDIENPQPTDGEKKSDGDKKLEEKVESSTTASSAAAAAENDSPPKSDGKAEEKKDAEESEPTPMDVDPTPSDSTVKADGVPDGDTADKTEETAPAVAASNSTVGPSGDSSGALSNSSDKSKSKLSMEERSGKFATMAKKRGRPEDEQSSDEKNDDAKDEKKEAETKEGEKEAEAVPAVYVTDSKGRRVKVIDDDAEELDCEFLNNRQAFLNLCQGNHYQYDHLRRAKHSSMMVLWHLHNRDAPKFVQQCTTCSREILQGYRFHCPTCADFDQCQECYQNPNALRHPHPLKPIPIAGQQTELTDAQRKERQRSIQLHMTLLLHAATCNSPKCPSANCTKMKGLLKHGAQCQQKTTGGCNVCKRIWALLQIHARQCKVSPCPVPNCMAIRERVRQLKKQQQAMDDRRRQEMNRVYRGAR
ncbi:MAG: hypothetical protein SGILL_001456, partial [Bacillariaceae sp.]